ncbi:MAG: hypothetical protein RR551_07950 [Mucinivorans sp.]
MMKIVNILIIALGVMLSSCTKAPMGGDEPLAEGTRTIELRNQRPRAERVRPTRVR